MCVVIYSKDIRQRSAVATPSLTPVGDLQATDRSNLLSFSSPGPRVDPRLWETLRRRTCAVGFLQPKIGHLNLTAPAHSSC